MAHLVDQVRRLIDLTVTCDVPLAEARAIADDLMVLNERLAQHQPSPAHPRFWSSSAGEVGGSTGSSAWEAARVIESMPYDVVVGRYNPLALPIRVEIVPPKAYASARFTTPYEGAPGWVHGAVIAGAFDIVLTAANHLEAAAGPTTRLDIRYRRPTLLDEEACFEAWIDHRRGKRVVSKGVLVQNGKVKVEAEGEFVTLEHDQRRLITRPKLDG
jgi:acyl-coenzyme A thioesterase PaaI-like protein